MKRKREAQPAAAAEPESSESEEESESEVVDESTAAEKVSNAKPTQKRKIIVLLDLASLETTKTKRNDYELLNCDDHKGIARKHGLDPAEYRPDILHQELLALIDSPLNKAGHMQIYIHTKSNVLIEVNPKIRIPRTFKRFSGLMVQLLHKFRIRASGSSEMLMKVIKNPFSRHIPAGCKVFGFSVGGTLYSPTSFANQIPDEGPVLLVFGAMASGSIKIQDHPYIEEMVSISEYPLSGACALNRICGAVEAHWGIV